MKLINKIESCYIQILKTDENELSALFQDRKILNTTIYAGETIIEVSHWKNVLGEVIRLGLYNIEHIVLTLSTKEGVIMIETHVVSNPIYIMARHYKVNANDLIKSLKSIPNSESKTDHLFTLKEMMKNDLLY